MAQLSPTRLGAKSGLAVVLIGLALVTLVNCHDLVAHMAGIDYCFALMEFDVQLALVEFAVPLVNILGSILTFIGVLFVLIQVCVQSLEPLEALRSSRGCLVRDLEPGMKIKIDDSHSNHLVGKSFIAISILR